MGTRGPVPKRTDQRRRTNKDPNGAVTKAPSTPKAPVIPEPDPLWHELAQKYYTALGESGQSAFFEPSDWMHARVSMEILSRMLSAGRLSAQLYAAWTADTARLLVTEGDRRRMRLELERAKPADPDADAGVASMDAWRTRLGNSG